MFPLLFVLLLTSSAHAEPLSYLGIRYTPQPLRFQASGPALPFDKTENHDDFGAICPQDTSTINMTGQNVTMSEDCLFLNLFTPTLTPPSPLPVMVYIYGGGFMQGWSQQMDSSGLATDTVQVNFNYRLNALGLFAHPDLQEESPNNATSGMNSVLDQVVALEWVQQNIHLFGGDPDRVTIYGESAGGCSVCYHLVSPLSKDLYKHAIVESGPCVGPWGIETADTREAFTLAKAFMFGAGAQTIEELRAIDVDDLMEKYGGKNYPLISYDNYVLQNNQLPADYIASGLINAETVVVGSNTVDSMDMEPWLSMSGKTLPSNKLAYEASIALHFAGFKSKVVEEYKEEADVGYDHAIQQISADICVRCPTVALAGMLAESTDAKVHMYSYAGAGVDGRAAHAAELCELFVDEPTCSTIMMQEFDPELSSSMAAYWTSVAIEGEPRPREGDPAWPAFPQHIRLGLEREVQEEREGFEHCQFWDELGIPELQLRTACISI